MKVPIDDIRAIDLNAPTVLCHERIVNGARRFVFDCAHCRRPHFHGPAEGHREAHCDDPASPYWRSGYNLVLVVTDCS